MSDVDTQTDERGRLVARFGRNIRRAREDHGLSQQQLAWAAGLNKRTVQRIEAGKSEPTFRNAAILAAVLSTSMSAAVGWDPSTGENQ